jgi:hypothetical protein
MRGISLIKKSVAPCLLLAVFALGSRAAYAYHDTLPPHAPVPGSRYGYDPSVMQPRQERRSFQGSGEQFYGNWRAYTAGRTRLTARWGTATVTPAPTCCASAETVILHDDLPPDHEVLRPPAALR